MGARVVPGPSGRSCKLSAACKAATAWPSPAACQVSMPIRGRRKTGLPMLGKQRRGTADAVGAAKVLRYCCPLRACGGDRVERRNCEVRGGGKAG